MEGVYIMWLQGRPEPRIGHSLKWPNKPAEHDRWEERTAVSDDMFDFGLWPTIWLGRCNVNCYHGYIFGTWLPVSWHQQLLSTQWRERTHNSFPRGLHRCEAHQREVHPSISNIALKLWSSKVCIWHIHLAADWAEWIVARTQNMESGRRQKPPQGQWPPGDSTQIDEVTVDWMKKTRRYERKRVH